MTNQQAQDVVVVTGSSGLLGKRIAADLSRDYQVVGLDIKAPTRDAQSTLTFVECDLTDEASVKHALGQVREQFGPHISAVVHLAAYYDFAGEPSKLYQELTVEGTRRLLRELRAFEVERVIFSSTLLVMKPAELGERLTERSPLQGEWDYPKSKIEAESVFEQERGDVPVTILRLAGVYDEEGHSPPITQQLARIYEKDLESYFFPGNAEHYQPLVHLDDAVRAVRLTVEQRSALAPFGVYLIAEEMAPTYSQLQQQMGTLLHDKEWPSLPMPRAMAKVGAWVKDKLSSDDEFIKPWMVDLADAHYPVSTAKAKQELGWRPTHQLQDTLPAMVENLTSDPARFYNENEL